MGAGLGVSLRYVRQFTEKTAGRVVAKAGLAGLELELGATQRVSEFSTAGMGVSVGTQVPHRAGGRAGENLVGSLSSGPVYTLDRHPSWDTLLLIAVVLSGGPYSVWLEP